VANSHSRLRNTLLSLVNVRLELVSKSERDRVMQLVANIIIKVTT
jgi:hypothetical protein